jgi:hypothetical protein
VTDSIAGDGTNAREAALAFLSNALMRYLLCSTTASLSGFYALELTASKLSHH